MISCSLNNTKAPQLFKYFAKIEGAHKNLSAMLIELIAYFI